tara:strand:- start:32517 stop:33809 length:1293 start_codon:yes stop_codon:yes gene_type:complete
MSVSEPVVDIFAASHDGTFNACVGENGMHDLRTYAEGYIDASILLLETLFEKQLLGSRDILVHPILYSARHAIELTIKHVLTELNQCDLKTEKRDIKGHNLGMLWALYKVIAQHDSRLMSLYQKMNPIVEYLDNIDKDAQDFRYPTGNAEQGGEVKQTYEGKRIVDLKTTHNVVTALKELLVSLLNTVDIVSEQRQLGSFTQDLNREELEELSKDCGNDTSAYFVTTKDKWKELRGLSGKGFIRAIEFIKKHREFAGNIGEESDLIALSSELLEQIIEFKLQDIQKNFEDRALPIFERAIKKPISLNAYEKLKGSLTPEFVAELEALYYLSFLSRYSETYEALYGQQLRNLVFEDKAAQQKECMKSFIRLFDKSPFLDSLIKSLRLIGQIQLSKKYFVELNAIERKHEVGVAVVDQDNQTFVEALLNATK